MIKSTKQSKTMGQLAGGVPAKKTAVTKQGSVKPQRAVAQAKPRTTLASGTPKSARSSSGSATSKTEKILALLQRPGGTTISAVMKATGWQAHSVRAFLSATIGKRMGLTVTSTLRENGERAYSIKR